MVSAAPPPAVSAAPPPSAAPTPSAIAPAPPPAAGADEEGHGTPLFGRLDDPGLPDAPCDLTRVYRGTVGKSGLTLRLALRGEQIEGLAHYDLPGPPLTLSGSFQGGALVVQEKGGGRFEGHCDGKSGRLTGTYALKKSSSPFAFVPRPLGEAALHTVSERLRVQSPVPAYCKGLGRTTETTMTKGGMCLPTDPKALAELQRESDIGHCALDFTSPRVFGLESAAAERLAASTLAHDVFAASPVDVRALVKRCELNAEVQAGAGFSVVYNVNDVLSVFFWGSASEANAAHPAMLGPEGMTLDLKTGRALALADVVTDEGAFRDAILTCAGGDADTFGWGTKDASRKTARWVMAPGGIAVVGGDFAPIMHGAEGKGPIASFAALAARRLLRGDSPVARLWAGVTPAAMAAPLCPTRLGSDEILRAP
jgi:hypothetical protein